MSEYDWSPLRLEVQMPVPMVRPKTIILPEPIPITNDLYRAFATGAGRIDMDIRWMWRWGSDDVIRLFRSWTGFEIFRLHVGMRDGIMTISAVEVESDPGRYADSPERVKDEMQRTMDVVREMPGYVDGWPRDRAGALAILLPERERPSATEAARQVQEVLPQRVARIRLPAEGPSAGPNVWLTHAEPDFECVRLRFSDGSLLWLVDPWRISVSDSGVQTEHTGALFWPAPGSHLGVGAAAWAVARLPNLTVVSTSIDHGGESREHPPAAPVLGPDVIVSIEFDNPIVSPSGQ